MEGMWHASLLGGQHEWAALTDLGVEAFLAHEVADDTSGRAGNALVTMHQNTISRSNGCVNDVVCLTTIDLIDLHATAPKAWQAPRSVVAALGKHYFGRLTLVCKCGRIQYSGTTKRREYRHLPCRTKCWT